KEPARAGVRNEHIIDGTVTRVTITDPGMGYKPAPRVVITGGGGSGATATARIDSSGSVTEVTVRQGGSGYQPLGVKLSDGRVLAAAEVSKMARGAVKKVKVTKHGTGYTRAPSVKFSDEGSGAIAIAQIDASGSVTDVTVREGGRGYTSDTTVTLVDPVPAVQAIVKPDDIIGGATTKHNGGAAGPGQPTHP